MEENKNKDQEKEPLPDEIGLEADSASIRSTPPEAAIEPPARRESRAAGALRMLLWALIVAAIAFAAGLAVEYYVIVRPQMATLQELADQANLKVETMTDQITDLEGQVSSLQPLETKNKTLTEQLDQEEMHVSLLSALSDITSAHLALSNQDPAAARLALQDTGAKLDDLKAKMTPDTQQVIADLQTRLENTLDILERNPVDAMTDFTVLENNLRTIENELFLK